MHQRSLTRLVRGGFVAAVLGTALIAPAGASFAQQQNPWTVITGVEFPPSYSPPTAFVTLSLDEALLDALLAGAPRETFGTIPAQTQIPVPLANGGFAQVRVARSQLMEEPLAAQFPDLRTYVFASEGLTGQFVRGPHGTSFSAQSVGGIQHVEPVETRSGRVYVSYFDAKRTDGANVIEHDPHMTDDDTTPPPVPFAPQALQPLGAPIPTASAGTQLRIYRLAVSTTGEFFQGRDMGNGLVDVVASILADLAGANAVLEPEVSVRLVLAAASTPVIYADPTMDPFDNTLTACTLRDKNRDNMKLKLNPADYDIGFLFASKAGGGANGCAWFVVCLTTNDTLHKARGAGLMGNNGANSASGLLAHEVGHQLGARHTFTGSAAGCTMNEFLAGNSQSGYEPGSGTTRMSYLGICGSDDVDVSQVPQGAYYHSRSFDEIVDNVFSGDGSTCGTLQNTTNLPPTVDAGADYTIPRQTPFMLSGTASDDEPLTFNWEQFDRAVTQRPINTDPGDGPLVRSVPPGTDSTRTIPRLQDLLDGVTRNGEILPQTDRDVNFRLIARDNLMGGGGVAYDSMKITVAGDPFFITAPNSGSLKAACQEPLTWKVGGGSVAPQVQALFSSDGGQTFPTQLTGAIPNDGADSFTVPCQLGSSARIKLQSVGNIFFDIDDSDLVVFNPPPVANVSTAGGSVDGACQFQVQFSGTASDSCGLPAANVAVSFVKAQNNFTLGVPTVNVAQVDPNQVSVSGSVQVSNLTSSPAQLSIHVTATDACGAQDEDVAQAVIVDDTPPQITSFSLSPSTLWPPDHKLVPITATVVATDNCGAVSFALTSLTSSEPANGLGDGDVAPDIVGAMLGTPDLAFLLRRERQGLLTGRVYTATYTAVDGSNNQTVVGGNVTVTQSQSP